MNRRPGVVVRVAQVFRPPHHLSLHPASWEHRENIWENEWICLSVRDFMDSFLQTCWSVLSGSLQFDQFLGFMDCRTWFGSGPPSNHFLDHWPLQDFSLAIRASGSGINATVNSQHQHYINITSTLHQWHQWHWSEHFSYPLIPAPWNKHPSGFVPGWSWMIWAAGGWWPFVGISI